jgi:SAM-dependent methyltransferase
LSNRAAQSEVSAAANAAYFLNNIETYRNAVSNIDTYGTINRFISAKVAGVDRLIDIGNGGVFDYDPSKVRFITAVDLFFAGIPPELLHQHFPPNATALQGSALQIPEEEGGYDMALMVMLLHHLSGRTWRESLANVRTAVAEAMRVLRPGGRLLIVESCVPRWFFELEKPAFSLLTSLTESIFEHPVTFQFPPRMICDVLALHSRQVTIERIPKGRYVLQFGFKVPSMLTPVQVFAFEAIKGG